MANLINTFTINQIHVVGTPTAQNVFNQFDEFGLLLGLPRFSGEAIESYKKRLMDTFSHRANSTYSGMINGITRELGLDLYYPFRIYPIKQAGVFLAENPIVIFNGPYVELWRDKENDILEMEIDRFDVHGEAYSIGDLVDTINTQSIYFRCDQPTTSYDRSMSILNQTNKITVRSELVPPVERFTLRFPGNNGGSIIPSSVVFSDTTIFQTLVNNAVSVINDGDYYYDPYTGDVISALPALVGTTITYDWIDYGFKPVASPVIIHDIESVNFKRKMFAQILGDDGVFHNGIPNEFGAQIINELMSVFPLYFST